jgi:hypothetical protein
MATLHIAPYLLLCLCPEGSDLFRRLGPHRGQELLGRHSCALKLLFTAFLSLRGKTLSLALAIGHRPLRPLLRLADDVGGCRVQPSLINDRRGFSSRSHSNLLGLLARLRQQFGGILARPREHRPGPVARLCEQPIGLVAGLGERLLSLSATVLERCLCFSKKALGRVPVSLGSQSSTFQSRLRLQAAALDKSFGLRLPVGRRALTGRRLLAKLAGLRGRATGPKPLAHQLQMTVNLGRVIALAYAPEVTLDHVRRTSLTFLARRHSPAVRYRIPDSFAIRPTPTSAWTLTSPHGPTGSARNRPLPEPRRTQWEGHPRWRRAATRAAT